MRRCSAAEAALISRRLGNIHGSRNSATHLKRLTARAAATATWVEWGGLELSTTSMGRERTRFTMRGASEIAHGAYLSGKRAAWRRIGLREISGWRCPASLR
jgi:hypothetical protein